ncbi:MAG: Ldh family oxidoreductase, partial [Pseudomonadota bacterium]
SALIADADLGFAPRTYPLALPALIEAARAQGMAALGIRRCVHFAVLWQEVEVLADAGLVAFAFTSSPPYVAPAGGRRAVFGTNPMAFAWPRPGKPPMVFDQASAAMARGDLQLHAREGRPVPLGVGVDAQGAPSTESRAILDGGAQLPFGGHKGAAIALMVDLLAGPLIDEVTSLESGTSASAGGPQPGGELLLALDPVALGGASGPARAEALFSALEGEPGVRLPGTRRLTERARTQAEGIAVPHALLAEIEALAEGRK